MINEEEILNDPLTFLLDFKNLQYRFNIPDEEMGSLKELVFSQYPLSLTERRYLGRIPDDLMSLWFGKPEQFYTFKRKELKVAPYNSKKYLEMPIDVSRINDKMIQKCTGLYTRHQREALAKSLIFHNLNLIEVTNG